MEQSILRVGRPAWIPGRWLCEILLGLTFHVLSIAAAYAHDPGVRSFPEMITLREGKLSARIVATPLRQVIAEIRRLSGAQIRWLNEGGEELISIEFSNLPVAEALQQILAEKNFLLFYSSSDKEERLMQLWISSGGHERGQLQPAPQVGVRDAEKQDSNLPVTLAALMQIALNDQDPAVRLEAIGHLEGYADEDPHAEALLSHLAHHDPDLQVQEAASEALARRQQ